MATQSFLSTNTNNPNPMSLLTNAANLAFNVQVPGQNQPQPFGNFNQNNTNMAFNQNNMNSGVISQPFQNKNDQYNAQFGNNSGTNAFGNQQAFGANNQNGLFGNINNTANTFNKGSFSIAANQPTSFGSNSFSSNNSFGGNSNSFNSNITSFPSTNNFNNTNFASPSKAPFKPVQPKNPKINDGNKKHLVKSITLLNENNGLCLKQLRIKQMQDKQRLENMNVGGNKGFSGFTSTAAFGFGANNPVNNTNATSTGFGFNNNSNNTSAGKQTSFSFSSTTPQNNNTGFFGGNNNATGGTFGGLNPSIPSFSVLPSNNPINPTLQTPSTFGFGSNSFTSPSKPNTGLFAPVNNNSVTVFPTVTPATGSILNNAAMNLATGALNTNMFGSTPNVGQQQTQAMITNRFLQSDFFKQIIRSSLMRESESENETAKKKSQKQALFTYYDDSDEQYIKISSRNKHRNSNKQKSCLRLYQQPYFYSQQNYQQQMQKMRKQRIPTYKFSPQKSQSIKKAASTIQILKKTPFSRFQQNYDNLQKRISKQIIVSYQDLPINDCGLILNPNIQKISTMSALEIQKLPTISFQNKYGKVTFMGTIPLLKKKLSQCIQIGQDFVQVKDPQWQSIRCKVLHKNFGGYKNANESEKKKIKKKILRWAQKNALIVSSFDNQTGDITYQTHF